MNIIEFYSKKTKYELEHSSLKGTKRDDANYYMREGQPGNYRYYKTKAEWDAHIEAQKRNAWEAEQKKKKTDELLKNIKPLSAQDIINVSIDDAVNKATNKLVKDTKKLSEDYRKSTPQYNNNQAAAEAEAEREAQRRAGEAKANKKEANWRKLKSKQETLKQEAAKRITQKELKSKQEQLKQEAAKRVTQRELKSKQEQLQQEAAKRVKRKENLKANQDARDAAIKEGTKKNKEIIEKTKKYIDTSKEIIKKDKEDLIDAVKKAYDGETKKLDKIKDNGIMKILDQYLKDNDEKYNGNITDYVAPTGYFGFGKQKQERLDFVEDVIESIAKELDNMATNEVTMEDVYAGDIYKALQKKQIKKKEEEALKEMRNTLNKVRLFK